MVILNMFKRTSLLIIGLFVLLFLGIRPVVNAQTTVNTSLFWTTGWCTICNTINGGAYACQSGSGSPMFNNGNGTFVNPVPTGNNVTQLCATVNYVCCGLSSITVNLNGVPIGTLNVPGGCNCNCGNCYSTVFCITNPGNYNYGGNNTIQVVPNGGNMCLNSVQVAITYIPACNVPITNNVISANQTLCSTNLPAALSGSTPGGGQGPYQYQWLSSSNNSTWGSIPGANTQNYTPGALTQNIYYRRRVFTIPGCIDTSASVVITVNNPILNNLVGTNQTICASGTPSQLTGSLPTGGNGTSFLYSWQSSTDNLTWATTSGILQNFQPSAILQTTYFRRVVTSGACPPNTSANVVITLYPQIGNNSVTANQTICTGSQPQAFNGALPTGGSGNYSYQWLSSSDSIVWSAVPGSTTMNYQAPALINNAYYRRIVGSTPCFDTSRVVFVRVDALLGNNVIITDQTLCAGIAASILTGSVTTGGSGSPSYSWESSLNGIAFNPILGANLSDYFPGVLGTTTYYRRVVTDGPCPPVTSNSVMIQVDLGIGSNTVTADQTICSGSIPNAFNGSLPTGGNNIYTYAWESGTDNVNWFPVVNSNSQGYQSGALTLTTYFRRVVNSGACLPHTSLPVTVLIEEPIGNNTVSSAQTICSGDIPAQFLGTLPTGGDLNYQYTWESSPDQLAWNVIPFANLSSFSEGALIANAYYRRIVTAGICTPHTSLDIAILVNPVPTVAVNNDQVCIGQTANLTAVPNLPGGSYLWSTGQNIPSINVSPVVNTTYTVVYTLSGCPSLPGSGVVTVFVPGVPNIVTDRNTDLCPGEAVNLTSDPGVSYSWSHNNTLNQQTVSISSTGTYSVTVTDINGCLITSLPISVTVHTAPTASGTGTAVACFGTSTGTLSAEASNGSPAYLYSWNTVPVQNTQVAFGVPAGTYTVTVTDRYNCRGTAQAIVVSPPQLLSVALMDASVDCNGASTGVATVLANGGVGPYTYAWNTSPIGTSQTVSNLAAGQYGVVSTDANGCIHSTTVIITEPNVLTITPSINPVRCFGESNGSITAIINGGTPNYYFRWSTTPVQTTPTAVNLRRGPYQVTVTDMNGCTASASYVMTQPDTLIARATFNEPICFSQSNGNASLVVTGGNGGYGYVWNTQPIQYSQTANNIRRGFYIGTVQDSRGCIDSAHVYVTEPRPIPTPIIVNDTICPGDDATLAADAIGNGLVIKWYETPGDDSPFHTGKAYQIANLKNTVIYQVQTEDAKGCVSPRMPIMAWVNNIPVVDFEAYPQVAEMPNALVSFTPKGTNLGLVDQWLWDFGDGQQYNHPHPGHQYQTEGFYNIKLTIVDTNGCRNTIVKPKWIEIRKMVNVVVPNAFSPNGDGVNDFFSLAYKLIDQFQIVIYDRWGNEVYTSNDPNFLWDGVSLQGGPSQEGTYVYVINGTTTDGSAVRLGGNVILIR